MAGLEFPTQKKPESTSEEGAWGGLPTPAWAMAKPKSAAVEKDKVPVSQEPVQAADVTAKVPEKKSYRLHIPLDAMLALVAVVAFASVGMLIVWFWPEFNAMFRRHF